MKLHKIKLRKIRFGGKGAWKKYLVGFLVLALIAGPIGLAGMFRLNYVYDAYEAQGYVSGHIDGYYKGYYGGWTAGEKDGFTRGIMLGYEAGYTVGITVLNDAYHQIALEFEKNNPELDVMRLWQMAGEDSSGNPATALSLLVIVPSFSPDFDIQQFFDDVLELFRAAYNGEKYLALWIADYNPSAMNYRMFYGYLFNAEKLLELGWEGFVAVSKDNVEPLLIFPVWVPGNWLLWVGNPYSTE